MVHSNKLVVALKVNGKFLRDSKDSENNNEVFVPFGTEYSIYLKNLHSERALVDIDVDGESAIKGLVVDAKSYNNYSINWVELERFHKGDNFIGHRFKFIEKTQEISEHRGDGPEDGLIVVSYRFEKPKPVYRPRTQLSFGGTTTRGMMPPPSDNWGEGAVFSAAPADLSDIQCNTNFTSRVSDAGITVEGSQSTQGFDTVHFGATETTTHSIVLKLRGIVEEQEVIQPVTTRTRVTCKTCGKRCETSWKMCSECGTSVKASATV
jgi:hypothetical protein